MQVADPRSQRSIPANGFAEASQGSAISGHLLVTPNATGGDKSQLAEFLDLKADSLKNDRGDFLEF